MEEEQSLVTQLQTKIKDLEVSFAHLITVSSFNSILTNIFPLNVARLQMRCEDLEEEIEAETQTRLKVEQQRALLQQQLDEVEERLEEAGGATQAQIELNRKREAEVARLRKELSDSTARHDDVVTQMKKKQQEVTSQLNEQLDAVSRARHKCEHKTHGPRVML